MFTARYFNPRYWASRFWAKVGGEISLIPSLIVTTDIQQAYTTNIDSPVFTTDKTLSYTTELGG